jgi:hypothetical protein
MKKNILILVGLVTFLSLAYMTMADLAMSDLSERALDLEFPAAIADPLRNSSEILSNVSANREDAGQDVQDNSGYDVQRESSPLSSGGCGCAKDRPSNQTTNQLSN